MLAGRMMDFPLTLTHFLERANAVLGVIQLKEELLDDDIQAAIDARQRARKERNFKESDRIRDELAAMGVAIKDGKDADGKPVTTWEIA